MAAAFRFVVDVNVNVGLLAKWLRIMGYDTVFPRDGDDNDLVRIALRENRVLVTRDGGFGLRRAARQGQLRVVSIADDDLPGQLRQLVRELKLDLESGFSRCVRCNESLHAVAKEEVAGRVPAYVRESHREFSECPGCRRVYWRGTHWTAMITQLDQVCQEAG